MLVAFRRALAVVYTRHVARNVRFARAFQFRAPPILLLSYPRSGSSWIGKILSTSPEVAYLQEPVNHARQRTLHSSPFFDPETDRYGLEAYRVFSDRAFLGIPAPGDLVSSVRDFSPFTRCRKRLLIKEVNPLAAGFFVDRHAPIIILLLRHPAAIAESFIRMGWLKEDGLEQFGCQYGRRMSRALEVVRRSGGIAVHYEDIATHPAAGFKNLFTKLDIKPPPDTDGVLAEYCDGTEDERTPYCISRKSFENVDKWRERLGFPQVRALKRGYMKSDLFDYRGEEHWCRAIEV